MADTSQIREDMEVVGSDDQRVGTVDRVENDRIKLTKNDPEAGGAHHYIPVNWVESVDQNRIRLNKSSGDAKAQWEETGRSAAGGDRM